MHLKELTHRSPLRVFERSVHGGLGRGNLGVVMAAAGVGKSAFVTCVALDDLLRDRRVLHVTNSHSVDHVVDFYDEMFADLARTANLEEAVVAREKVERHRFIRSLNGKGFRLDSFRSQLALLAREVDFRPDVVIIDGHDVSRGGVDGIRDLRATAREHAVEVWLTHRLPRTEEASDWHELPPEIARLGADVSVVVLLQPVGDAIRIRLLKDHDNPELADLSLDLDPKTYLVRGA